MNIAIIKHIGNGAPEKEYLFQVPSKEKITKGTLVKVKTKIGESYGILTRDSFEVDGDALEYIRQSLGAPKDGDLSTVTAVMVETPFDIYRVNSSLYSTNPVVFKAKRKDNGGMMESPCLYTTSEGKMYLGTTNAAAEIVIGQSGNIYKMEWAGEKAIFREIKPETLEWTVEK